MTLLTISTLKTETSVSRQRPFPPIRITSTLHAAKSDSVPSLNELAVEADRWDRISGMLIHWKAGSRVVVIKDSISQRSVWCDHILPLTDGVSLTSALWRRGCHERRHHNLWKRAAWWESCHTLSHWVLNSCVILSCSSVMPLFMYKSVRESGCCSSGLALKCCHPALSSHSRKPGHASPPTSGRLYKVTSFIAAPLLQCQYLNAIILNVYLS